MPKGQALTRRDLMKYSAVATLLPGIGAVCPAEAMMAESDDGFQGLKIGVATYTFRKLSLDATIKGIQRVGLRYASIKDYHMPHETTAAERKAIAQKFRDAGITPMSCGNITMENTEASVRDAFQYARDAGIPTIVGSPHPDAMKILDKMVREFDIKLAIHNHGPEDERFPSPYDVYKAVQPYDKRIGLCIDVGHSMRAGTDPAEAILKCRDRLYDVHLKDISSLGTSNNPMEVGRGILNEKAIYKAVVDIKFAFMAAFEYEKDEDDPIPGLAESVGYTRAVLRCIGGRS
jgi:inosose dehydratase